MGGPSHSPCERAGVTSAPCARAVSEGRGGESRGAPPGSHTAGARQDPPPARGGDSTSFRGSSVRQENQPVIATTVAVVVVVIARVIWQSVPARLGEDLGK